MSRGFTIIELLLVVAMMGSALALAAPVLDTLVQAEDLKSQGALVVDALREAQSAAMSGYAGGAYGVHFTSGDFTLFPGQTYVPLDPANVVHEFSGFVGIIDVSLSDLGVDVVFDDRRGTPNQAGTVTLVDSNGSTVVVTIGGAGLLQTD